MNAIIPYTLSFLISLLLLSCAESEPQTPQVVPQASKCTIDTKVAPLWACEIVEKSLITVSGDANKSMELFKEFQHSYILESEKILVEKKIAKSKRADIIDESLINLDTFEKEWKDEDNATHVLYALSRDALSKRLEKSLETYKHTRTYKNCFKTGKVSLGKNCKREIRAFLKETPLEEKKNIIIQVHTDKGGSAKKNLSISKKRALNVALSLQTQEQKNSKIYYAGYGESQLLYDSQTKEANFHNRRVVVSVKDKKYKSNAKVLASYKTKGFVPFKPEIKKPKKKQKKSSVHFETTPKVIAVTPVVKKYVNIKKYTGKSLVGHSSKFSISCADDAPIEMKRKEVEKAKKSAFMSAFYKKRISGTYKDKYVEIYPVNIFKNGALGKEDPTVRIYSDRADTMRYETEVNLYKGTAGLLYRVFIKGKSEIKCMDFVLSYSHAEQKYARVYLEKNGKLESLKFVAE